MLELTYLDRAGRERVWEAVGRVNALGVVVVVPVTEGGEVVLIRQYRPALDRFVIELPAGLIDPGEDVFEAGRRELIEETGHEAGRIEILTEGVMSTGIETEPWTVLLAEQVTPASPEACAERPADENEDIDVLSVPLGEAALAVPDLLQEGEAVDLRIYGLLELARRRMAP
jgi:ADP-ribose pyrophosphatase